MSDSTSGRHVKFIKFGLGIDNSIPLTRGSRVGTAGSSGNCQQ